MAGPFQGTVGPARRRFAESRFPVDPGPRPPEGLGTAPEEPGFSLRGEAGLPCRHLFRDSMYGPNVIEIGFVPGAPAPMGGIDLSP